jgi:hypothetical protein
MDNAEIIDITSLHTDSHAERPKSTLTITRRSWSTEDRRRLATLLFGPRPGEDAA